MDKH